MRKHLLIIILSGLFVSNIAAQKVKIGIVAGPAISSKVKTSTTSVSSGDSSRDRISSPKSSFSFFGGVVAAIPVSKNIIFKPQLQYIVKGWRIEYDRLYREDYNTKLVSHWIELPLNFVYTVPAKNGRFFIGLGPYVSCALSGKVNDSREGRDKTIEFKKNDSSNTTVTANRIDAGANIIAGYEFRNGLFISLNYSRGFIDFRNDANEITNPQNKNRVAGLGIGYMFK
jgi:hypothetical protein